MKSLGVWGELNSSIRNNWNGYHESCGKLTRLSPSKGVVENNRLG